MLRIAIFLFVLAFIGRNNYVKSQSLHTPAQLLRIMEQSTLNYTIDSLIDIEENKAEKILGRKEVNKLLLEDVAPSANPKGLNFLNQGDCSRAIKILVKKSNNYGLLSLANQLDLCDCLQKEGDWEGSIPILLGLQNNYPRHFEIARRLAGAYKATEQPVLAYHQILMAWLLNRNHPLIQNEAQSIGESLGKDISQWKWSPQVKVVPQEGGARISYQPPNSWLAYGLCEAVWDYEPNYASQMQSMVDADLENTRAMECLMNAIITYSSDSHLSDSSLPEMEALKRAIEKKMTAAFILFEMRLPKNPSLALQLTDAQMEMLETYLDTCR